MRMRYVGFTKAKAWDHALAMAPFRSSMIELARVWPPTSAEHRRYMVVVEGIDACAAAWGFSASDLYAVGDGSTAKDRRNPFR